MFLIRRGKVAERGGNLVYMEEEKYLWMMGRQIDCNGHLPFFFIS